MSIEDNKAIATAFVRRLEALDYDGATALMTPDVTWWDVMRGTLSNDVYLDAAKQFGQFYKSPIKLTVHGMTAEEDRVAVELESYVTMTNEKIYNNTYHVLLKIRNGKIASIKEYMNTKHVMEIVSSLY